jgi:hypothetical protein
MSFGDGTSAVGSVVRHTFKRPGSDRMSLTVTDDSGVARTSTRTIILKPKPPKRAR